MAGGGITGQPRESPMSPLPTLKATQAARLVVQTRSASLRMGVRVTPAGILAIGGLVSSILLSTSALVWVSVSQARRHRGLNRGR
jgi:hypothetical protein